MKILSAKSRIATGQVGLLVTVLLAGSFLGLIPDRIAAIRDGRAALAESIAANSSALMTQKDVWRLEGILRLVVERNEDLLSAALRTETGRLIVAVGDHDEHWRDDDSEFSTNAQVKVSIWAGRRTGKGLSQDDERFAWLRQLLEWQRDLQDPREFLDTVKIDLFPDQVYVFTPQGEVKRFPKGATPIDFAYAIHTDVGNRCSGARVNGKLVPLRYQLRNGDIIEILASTAQRPSKDWLDLVVTAKARNKIRHVIHQEERERSTKLGTDLLEREFRRAGMNYHRMVKRGEIRRVLDEMGLKSPDALQSQVGYGKISARGVLRKLVPPEKLEPRERDEGSKLGEIFRRALTRSRPSGIKIQGLGDVLVRFGKCCTPVPGDDVVGFITRGRGVTIHTTICQKGLLLDPERRVSVEWKEDSGLLHPVKIRIVSIDAPWPNAQSPATSIS